MRKNCKTYNYNFKRKFDIHYQSLVAAVKSEETLKQYRIYINLHSLTRNKSIHNYKDKYKLMAQQCGVSDYILRKYLNLLFKYNLVWEDWSKKHLCICSTERYADFLEVPKSLTAVQFNQTKFFRVERKEFISADELQALSLQILVERKRYKYVEALFNGKRLSKRKLSNPLVEGKLKDNLANNPDAQMKMSLYLQDVAKHFGGMTIQGASQRLKTLKQKGFIEIKKQLRFIKSIKHADKRIDNKTFIKNGWLIEQMPNHIIFNTVLPKSEITNLVDNHFSISTKLKAEKIAEKSTHSMQYLLTAVYNNRPIFFSKRKFVTYYIDRTSGEIVHEHLFYQIRNLTIKGYSLIKKHITKFKKLCLITYEKKTFELGI